MLKHYIYHIPAEQTRHLQKLPHGLRLENMLDLRSLYERCVTDDTDEPLETAELLARLCESVLTLRSTGLYDALIHVVAAALYPEHRHLGDALADTVDAVRMAAVQRCAKLR